MRITASEAIDDPNLLGSAFAGSSWATWRAVLRAAEGLPLNDDQHQAFARVAERDPPAHRVRELWAIVGRRGGKDSIASAIATAAAIGDYTAYLRPGERAAVLCLAVNREQARIVQRYTCGYFANNALLRPLVARETDDGLELTNGVDIVVATNSYRSVRGRTIVVAILDEVGFWRDVDSATPDIETYNAVMPALVTMPGSMLVGITTAYRRSGLAFDKWRRHYGQPDDDILVVKGSSRAFNDTVPQAIIDAAIARDPEAAAAEWLSEWRSDLADFLDRELIAAAVDDGVPVRPPQERFQYHAFADPSGGRGDSFTCAISHAEGKTAIIDAMYERRAPFDPVSVVAEIAELLRSYRARIVVGDKYSAEWVVSAFRSEAITYKQSERDRSALYLGALPLFTSGRARLIDNPRLVHQLASLERRTSRLGKDIVDHGAAGHDDLANAAAGALTLAATKTGFVISDEALERFRHPRGLLRRIHSPDQFGGLAERWQQSQKTN